MAQSQLAFLTKKAYLTISLTATVWAARHQLMDPTFAGASLNSHQIRDAWGGVQALYLDIAVHHTSFMQALERAEYARCHTSYGCL